uniref:Golgin candidate 4 n=1 Tax=Kalanchoe fedtschenkoi TaxID=63787 RepID=A0A7N0T2A2_KALFE
MWGSIANLKENLHKIALDVHDHDEDDDIPPTFNGDRGTPPTTTSRRFSYSNSTLLSPLPNGISTSPEVEQYKAKIKKLQDSESEMKALSINYAALLKEKEDHITRLNIENGSLKKNLEAAKAVTKLSRNGSQKTLGSGPNTAKVNGEQSPDRNHKLPSHGKNIATGIHMENTCSLDERNEFTTALQANHELRMKQMMMELEKEHNKCASIQRRLQEERKLNESLREDFQSLNIEKNKISAELSKLRSELDDKVTEITQLQIDLQRHNNQNADDVVDSLKRVIRTLEMENTTLKREKIEFEASLKEKETSIQMSQATGIKQNALKEALSSGSYPEKEEMERSLKMFEKDLKEARQERDKALQQLNRLKQHLLEKESEESEKMDEDSKLIEELRRTNEYQQAQILHLDNSLKQVIASRDELKMNNELEVQKAKEAVEDLNRKLASCAITIETKNVELQNLQTVLGQYSAEIEVMESLERDLALAREHSAKLSEQLKDTHYQIEMSKGEKEHLLAQLAQAERMCEEGKKRVSKLEEDNEKLRRALEQSMTRLNRMSMDSDFFVDRRIVIKLLVTYFQRNHSKEVLDLMVRMLGFSDEDKQRIGMAQQGAGKGVVRGVLGLPGRLVGGILGGGGGPVEASANTTSDNQSFADLWVDFLLKETEERERREATENSEAPNENPPMQSPNAGKGRASYDLRTPPPSNLPSSYSRASGQSPHQYQTRSSIFQSENSESEFSTVPLTTPESSSSRISRLLPKY